MRFILLMVAALLTTATVEAQDARPSSSGSTAAAQASSSGAGPVSLDRIRDGLSRSTLKPLDLTAGGEIEADYRVDIQQQLPIGRFFRPEDFKPGPVPFG